VAIAGSVVAPRDAIAVGPPLARLIGQAAGSGMPASLGLDVQAIPPALRPVLGAGGILVARVVPGSPADKAGIAAGEVCTQSMRSRRTRLR
jgi:S1-C subfamily serine protease